MSHYRIGIYTCVTGGYDEVSIPEELDPLLMYFCLTDAPDQVPSPWKAVPVSSSSLSPKDLNRFAKMLPVQFPELKDLDASLYVDGSFIIRKGLRSYIEAQLEREGDIFMFHHPYRQTLFAEAMAVCEAGHEWPLAVAKQLRSYARRGFEDQVSLYAGGVILRRHTERTWSLMERWWDEYQKGIRRDQLSLGFAMSETGIPIQSLGPMPLREGNEQLTYKKKHLAKKPLSIHVKRFVGLAVSFCNGYPLLFGRSAPPDVEHPYHRVKARFVRSISHARKTITGQSADE